LLGMSFNLPVNPSISFRGFRFRGLCFLGRKSPYGKIRLVDEDWEINLAEEKEEGQFGFIVATKGLTDEDWKPFEFGELLVFKDGKAIYSNYRNVSEIL
ncbi:hypothetical protein DRN73_09960, partial [Candidatus Pacearchaeota archaeon]